VALLAAHGVRRVEPRSERDVLVVRAPREVKGPLRAHARVGTLLVRAGGRTLASIPVVTERAIPAPPLPDRVGHFVVRPITLLVIAALLGGTGWALRRRRAARARGKRPGIGTA
jgi:D-alanyl-D-alanine carboxypeptidase (penicillin-binding protein 5/6)